MNKNIKRGLLAVTLAGTLLLSGCGADKVATDTGISIVREDTGSEYRFTTAKTGTVTLTETVRVKYFAANQESYGFSESGIYYNEFSVSIGDEVKAGDVLATLDCTAIDVEINKRENTIAELELSLERNQQLLTLFDERQGDKPLSAEESARRRGYETAIRDANDEKAIVETELAQLRKQREGRVIIAAIDGTVTFVRDVQPGETSVNGRSVITVTDLDTCAFTASVKYPEAISADEIYTVTIDGSPYDIVAATAEELGIEEEAMNEKSQLTRVYFKPLTPTANLAADATGNFTMTVASHDDTIYIPAGALTYVDGVTCVYVPSENGLMSVRQVTVGIETNRYIEITEGLEAGESIILY